ncbi:hypothetical protein AgCh_015509 [Apium graveolens]
MVSQQHEPLLENPIFFLDALFCEEPFDEQQDLGTLSFDQETATTLSNNNNNKALILFQQDFFWENDELLGLLEKEKLTLFNLDDESVMQSRGEAVDWILRVCCYYGFNGLTVALAVNYFDRFLSSFNLQNDKPWMSQLVAVACLSLAAKVEETQVPLLVDLQVEDSRFLFDSRSIQRMELLVLASLEWKMNPVTPFSFFDHIIRRLELESCPHWEFLRRCGCLFHSIVADSRILRYLPSVVASAIMCLVIKEVDLNNAPEFQNQLMEILKLNKERVDECCNLITELLGDCGYKKYLNHKRKYCPVPSSPNGIINGDLSCDSASYSWTVASSVSSSPEPCFKKSRATEQQMRLHL